MTFEDLGVQTRLAAEAFRAFDRWRAVHDPDGEMDVLDAAVAYSEYAQAHGIAKYLDAAQAIAP